jgi:hypothetical protein
MVRFSPGLTGTTVRSVVLNDPVGLTQPLENTSSTANSTISTAKMRDIYPVYRYLKDKKEPDKKN